MAGPSRRAARKAGIVVRAPLGLTPVARVTTPTSPPRSPGTVAPPPRSPGTVAPPPRSPGRVAPGAQRPGPGGAEPQAHNDAVLEISHLSVEYGYGDQAVRAVMDCDLVLRRGKVLGLAGESGSGKTTLALAAIRLLRAPAVITGGSVLLDRKSVV